MKINKEQWKWTREPKNYSITDDKIEIITNPHTDLCSVLIIISGMTMHLCFR